MADEVVRHVQDVSIVAHHKGIQGHQTLWLAQSIHCRNGVRQDGRGGFEPDNWRDVRPHQLGQDREAARGQLGYAHQGQLVVFPESLFKRCPKSRQSTPTPQRGHRNAKVTGRPVQCLTGQ